MERREQDYAIGRRKGDKVEPEEAGLNFVAFGHSLAAFEALLRCMGGGEDGIPDAPFPLQPAPRRRLLLVSAGGPGQAGFARAEPASGGATPAAPGLS